MARIAIRNIAKNFPNAQAGGVRVLENFSLDVENGEFLTILGPSGCGKTTLIRIIAGLELQSAGSIEIDGVPMDNVRASERNVAMVFQSYALYPHMSVFANLALPLKMRRMTGLQRLPGIGRLVPGSTHLNAQIDNDVREVAALLELTPLLDRRPGQLSGGQRQRVALARAMVRRPAVFLMDEPLSNLDANMRGQMRSEILELHRRLGTTFLYVTHDQTEAMSMSSRIVVMLNGKMQQVGRPCDIYEDPDSLAVASFVGEPKINLLEGVVRKDGAVQCHDAILPADIDAPAGTPVTVAIRPEDFTIGNGEANAFAVTVNRNEYLGHSLLLHVQLKAGVGLVVQAPNASHCPPSTRLKIKAQRVLYFGIDGQRMRARRWDRIATGVHT